jgi:putative colanic acid biosynthesis glycosyltransferase WcaI
MATVHILTQYVWPDAAPTGLYAEHLAQKLEGHGRQVRLVGGQGDYRSLQRPKPVERVIHLDHYQGRRGSLRQTFSEYASVTRAFRAYIAKSVRPADLVIVTSAPPNTVTLAAAIRCRGARGIYWLQDYYPELVRGLREYPRPLRQAFRRFWDGQLAKWDRVVKIGANLGGPSHNAIIIRNWPTLSFPRRADPEPCTALYSGNLGYGHDIGLLVAACAELRDAGYRITMRSDGRGTAQLPAWLKPSPLEIEPGRLREELLRHEVHLVAADPKITQAIFPSKIWNSLATGRRLICTGFAGEMATELEAVKRAPFWEHCDQWFDLIRADGYVSEPATSNPLRQAVA